MLTRNPYQIWWYFTGNVNAGVTTLMPIGCNLATAFDPYGYNLAHIRDLPYFSFSLRGTFAAGTTLTFRTMIAYNNPASNAQWFAYVYATSGAIETVYNMPAPYGGAGSNGRLVTTGVFLQCRLTSVGGNTTNIAFMARAWRE
jgi:hypothetical protein